jgi:nucleotide-binding universal stress UspA family protein
MDTMPSKNGRLKILVGHDFSTMGDRAVEVAVNLARAAGEADLHLVHVVSPAVAGIELAPVVDAGELVQNARRDLSVIVDKLAAPSGLHAFTHVLVGDARRDLPRLADENEVDLIVIGTHGRRGLDRMMFGSVAEHVVRFAPCSVLTVRPLKKSAADSIEPPCAECTAVAVQTSGKETRCAAHHRHHPRAHTYSELPPSFGVGSMTFRF